MDERNEKLEAEMRAMKPTAADDAWVDRVSGTFIEEPARSHRIVRWLVPLAAAACIVAGVSLFWPGASTTQPSQTVVLASGWSIEPTGDAAFRVVDDGRVALERGELYIASVQSVGDAGPVQDLIIETPDGTAHAAGTRFYIGSHSGPSIPATLNSQGPPSMKRLTRVLVLAGAVTLTNPLGSVTGSANELLAAEADKSPTKIAVTANSDFNFDLYRQLSKENAGENLFFSSYSISSALAMTTEGARGDTAMEMGEVLRFPEAALRVGDDAQLLPWRSSLLHIGFAELNNRFNGESDDAAVQKTRDKIAELRKELAAANQHVNDLQSERKWREASQAQSRTRDLAGQINKLASTIDQYELNVANALWGEKTYPFEQAYIDTIAEHYGTGGVAPMDFRNDFPAAREQINDWIAEQTADRIKDIIPDLPPNQAKLMRLILTNAIYFKGEWEKPFDKKHTKDRGFMLADGKSTTAPIMFARNLDVARYAAFNADGSPFDTPRRVRVLGAQTPDSTRYPGADGFAMVELPYKGGDLSMVVIAPNKPGGLGAVESAITREKLDGWIAKLVKRETHVHLPRFKLETEYQLGDTLQTMGMKRAFTDPRLPNGADFTGMSASDDPMNRLYISKVIHKAFVEVNEKGTEAAAATAVIMVGATSAPIDVPFTPEFKADRPFIYLIRDKSTGALLFMGRVMNPATK